MNDLALAKELHQVKTLRHRRESARKNMTTYVFGAGASRDVGYPLAADMGDGLLDFMLKSPDPSIQGSGRFLIDTFGRSPNIEDLITELESRVAQLKDAPTAEERAQRMRLGNRRAFLGTSLQFWFREIHLRPAPSYAAFATSIAQPGDVILTFNYDDSLERELRATGKWDISRGYGFPLGAADQASDIRILKLHGSMNWLVSVFGGATGGAFLVNPASSLGRHPVIHRVDLNYLGYHEFVGHTYESGGAFPCLILPGRTKEFFYDTSLGQEFALFWDHLWAQAAHAIKQSDKIVLCGYSLLAVDQRACDLLLRTPQKQTPIEVVSGNQTERIAQDFRNAGFHRVTEFQGGYFADWCNANS
jgi:hypothetical protein